MWYKYFDLSNRRTWLFWVPIHNFYIGIPQLHIENQGSEGQFGEISCENGFSRQFRRRYTQIYTVLGLNKYWSWITILFFAQTEVMFFAIYCLYSNFCLRLQSKWLIFILLFPVKPPLFAKACHEHSIP